MKIMIPAVMNRIEANIKGGNSVTAILFKRYVDPQITYIEKKAKTMRKAGLLNLPITKFY